MVNREQLSVKRRTRRQFVHILPIILIGIVAVLSLLSLRSALSPAPYREAIIVISDPIHILSFDTRAKKITAVDLPSDTVIQGAMGYGKYPTRAIVSLDEIDHRNGNLITGSVSNAIGLPIAGHVYMGTRADGVLDASRIRTLFSLGSVYEYSVGKFKGSLPLLSWIRFVLLSYSIPADGVKIIGNTAMTNDIPSPDGGTVRELDESRVDYLLDTAFFDGGIRSEALSVAVYNTTAIPFIGQRASRQLSKVGVQMVFVGNRDTELPHCVLTGSREHLTSKTAHFIRSTYGCLEQIDDNEGKEVGADIVLLLGKSFAERFK